MQSQCAPQTEHNKRMELQHQPYHHQSSVWEKNNIFTEFVTFRTTFPSLSNYVYSHNKENMSKTQMQTSRFPNKDYHPLCSQGTKCWTVRFWTSYFLQHLLRQQHGVNLWICVSATVKPQLWNRACSTQQNPDLRVGREQWVLREKPTKKYWFFDIFYDWFSFFEPVFLNLSFCL